MNFNFIRKLWKSFKEMPRGPKGARGPQGITLREWAKLRKTKNMNKTCANCMYFHPEEYERGFGGCGITVNHEKRALNDTCVDFDELQTQEGFLKFVKRLRKAFKEMPWIAAPKGPNAPQGPNASQRPKNKAT